jgi:hypothetical protein
MNEDKRLEKLRGIAKELSEIRLKNKDNASYMLYHYCLTQMRRNNKKIIKQYNYRWGVSSVLLFFSVFFVALTIYNNEQINDRNTVKIKTIEGVEVQNISTLKKEIIKNNIIKRNTMINAENKRVDVRKQ